MSDNNKEYDELGKQAQKSLSEKGSGTMFMVTRSGAPVPMMDFKYDAGTDSVKLNILRSGMPYIGGAFGTEVKESRVAHLRVRDVPSVVWQQVFGVSRGPSPHEDFSAFVEHCKKVPERHFVVKERERIEEYLQKPLAWSATQVLNSQTKTAGLSDKNVFDTGIVESKMFDQTAMGTSLVSLKTAPAGNSFSEERMAVSLEYAAKLGLFQAGVTRQRPTLHQSPEGHIGVISPLGGDNIALTKVGNEVRSTRKESSEKRRTLSLNQFLAMRVGLNGKMSEYHSLKSCENMFGQASYDAKKAFYAQAIFSKMTGASAIDGEKVMLQLEPTKTGPITSLIPMKGMVPEALLRDDVEGMRDLRDVLDSCRALKEAHEKSPELIELAYAKALDSVDFMTKIIKNELEPMGLTDDLVSQRMESSILAPAINLESCRNVMRLNEKALGDIARRYERGNPENQEERALEK